MSKTPKGKGKPPTNTLFSYFKKTPDPKTTNSNGCDPRSSEVLSPRRSPNTDKPKESPKVGKTYSRENVKLNDSVQGDLVWAKLEGYPWWPSLVCNHPNTKSHTKGSNQSAQVHVQFFDVPPCRAWIKARYIKPFKGSSHETFQKGGQFYTLNNKIRQGALDADKALDLSPENRLKLVVELQLSSDEEDEEEEVERMDFDPSIFDAEMSDEDIDSKENSAKPSQANNKEVTVPQKSPEQHTKIKRRAAKVAAVKSKRQKLNKSGSGDEESEDDFRPESSDDEDESASSGVDEEEISSEPETEPEPESPVKKPIKRKKPETPLMLSSAKKASVSNSKSPPFSPAVSESTKSKLSLFSAPETSAAGELSQKDASTFPHVHLDFLQPEKIRDINRKLKTDPDYNSRTLYVPESFLNKQTPAMRQWWELKSQHFDTVLFFKVGKFYELYHMDAVAGVTEVGLIYMKGDFAHSGFPEIAYNRYADALLQKGYKVARVEQTETPDMMAERCKQMGRMATKHDKVVKREVCQVSTQGTRTYSHLDGDCVEAKNNYILALCEKIESQDSISSFGVCFVDTSIGTFHVGQFEDDRHLSRLRTVIAHYTPTQVLYERGKLSPRVDQLLNVSLTSAMKEGLSPGTEFWDSGKTLKTLAEEEYFKGEDGVSQWPEVIKSMQSESDALGLTAAECHDLALRSLGALTWYLQYCLMDQELLSMNKFEMYKPVDLSASKEQREKRVFNIQQRHMVLDGVTMSNLDVVWNEGARSVEGTLLERLDHCSTAFGKRLFRQWLCAPLCQPASINDRLDAVDDLLGAVAVMDESVAILKKLPDLERLLGRIHSIGTSGRSKEHPNNRAILYEEVTYSKRKIEDFLTTIDGFKSAVKIIEKFSSLTDSLTSKVLRRSVTLKADDTDTGGHFPDISQDLDFFDTAFNHQKARKDGVIVPSKGVDEEYDAAVRDIETVEKALGDYLETQKKILHCRSLTYWGNGKNRYQLEVPESALRNLPDSYEVMSSKKGAKRYRTEEINDLLSQLTDAEERKATCLKDIMTRIFRSFDERHAKWKAVVECLSVLDVLISLATYSRAGECSLCRPQFVLPKDGAEPILEIRDGRHPCVSRTYEGGDFIPNDTLIGVQDEMDEGDGGQASEGQVVLVTGPNMGGKSTLMRQVGLITIMAQMGCYVPAEKCRLTPVDRIFTRLGANDKIMAGESTFFVELSETSSILQHASKFSLILMDELGRGTATYDGTAIACSVVKELSQNIRCRCLFSTHYHSLVEEFKSDANVRLGHMSCMVENENDGDPSQETITFLYKFVPGACPKSYGFNAARLADIPEEVIQCAVRKSKHFEESVDNIRVFRNLWELDGSDGDLSSLVQQLV